MELMTFSETESARKNGLLLAVSALMLTFLTITMIWGLYTHPMNVSSISENSSVMVPDVQSPEPVKEIKLDPPKRQAAVSNEVKEIVRKENIQNILETPKEAPPISTQKTTSEQRPLDGRYRIGSQDLTPSETTGRANSDTPGTGLGTTSGTPDGTGTKEEPIPEVKPKPTPSSTPKVEEPVKPTVKKSLGVITGKAIVLPKPVYPATAIAMNIQGSVSVMVTINKQGKVTSAIATSGHPLLRAEAVRAAKQATFSPTLLSNETIEVSGTIVYNFTR